MFAAIVISVLLLVLLVPSWIVLFLHRATVGKAVKAARPVWIAQILASVFFILLAESRGLAQPRWLFAWDMRLRWIGGRFLPPLENQVTTFRLALLQRSPG